MIIFSGFHLMPGGYEKTYQIFLKNQKQQTNFMEDKKMVKDFNLNHGSLFVGSFECGITTGTIKAGHKIYNYCLKKNACNSRLEVWQGKGSKYNSSLVCITLNNKAVVYKETIQILKSLADAQHLTKAYENILA